MAILEFIFKSFWHFIGTIILIGVFFGSIVELINAIRNNNE